MVRQPKPDAVKKIDRDRTRQKLRCDDEVKDKQRRKRKDVFRKQEKATGLGRATGVDAAKHLMIHHVQK